MNVRYLVVALSVALVVACACSRGGDTAGNGLAAIESCDYGPACAQAVQKAGTIPDLSPEFKARLLHIRMNALIKFPEADSEFIESIGLKKDRGYLDLITEQEVLSRDAEAAAHAADARQILAFLQAPVCAGFMELEALQKGGGLFADSAAIARMSALMQLLSAVTPENSGTIALAVRQLVGCTLSERAELAAVMVSAKNLLIEILERCPVDPGADLVFKAVCAQGKDFVSKLSIPLPMSDSRSGEFAGALVPGGRQMGMLLNPPWMLSLAAGRLMVVDQVVLAPEARQVPELAMVPLMDLRQTHRQDDIKTSIYQAMKTRKVWKKDADDRASFIFLAVDKSTTFADLADVADAIMSETDAFLLLAIQSPGATHPVWRSVNFFIRTMPLFSPDGQMSSWAAVEGQPEFELTPFSLIYKGKSVELVRGGKGLNAEDYDLRAVNKLAEDIVGNERPRAAAMKVSPAVTVGLMIGVLEAMSVRFDKDAHVSAGAFASSQGLRKSLGKYDVLLPWTVVERNIQ